MKKIVFFQRLIIIGILILSTSVYSQNLSFRVLTYNVWGIPKIAGGKYKNVRLKKICEQLHTMFLDKRGPDIVNLQEVWTAADRKLFRNCGYVFTVSKQKKGNHGLMVLSKWPLHGRSLFFEKEPMGLIKGITTGEGLVRKGILMAEVFFPWGPAVVINTHLTSRYPDDKNEDIRRKEIMAIDGWIKRYPTNIPMMLGGDFNFGHCPYKNCNVEDTIAKEIGTDVLENFHAFPHDLNKDVDDQEHFFTCSDRNTNRTCNGTEGPIDYFLVRGFPPFQPGDASLTFQSLEKIKGSPSAIPLSDHYGFQLTVRTNQDGDNYAWCKLPQISASAEEFCASKRRELAERPSNATAN